MFYVLDVSPYTRGSCRCVLCRQLGQGTVAEQRGRDYRKELEDRERTAREKKDRGRTHGTYNMAPFISPTISFGCRR